MSIKVAIKKWVKQGGGPSLTDSQILASQSLSDTDAIYGKNIAYTEEVKFKGDVGSQAVRLSNIVSGVKNTDAVNVKQLKEYLGGTQDTDQRVSWRDTRYRSKSILAGHKIQIA